MTENKRPIPAALSYQASGKLPPIDYDWQHVLTLCFQAQQEDKEFIVLPVELPWDTKKHKVKLAKGKGNPVGIVLKPENEPQATKHYYPYLAVRFSAEEVAKYAGQKIDEVLSGKG
jgi:hypothetical protein